MSDDVDVTADAEQGSELVVGIDLGTTNSLVAYCDERGPRVLEDSSGRRLLPSVVRFGQEELVIGEDARASSIRNADLSWMAPAPYRVESHP